MSRARIPAAIIVGLAVSALVTSAVLAAVGDITTVAGDGIFAFGGDGGPATNASLRGPTGLAVDAEGNLFIAGRDSERVRRVDAGTGVITSVAGNGTAGFSGDGGPATSASLRGPTGLAVDAEGNLFIADTVNQRVRRVDVATGIITTVAGGGATLGDGGSALNASLVFPFGVAVDAEGNLFITDRNGNRIRKVTAGADGKVDGDSDDIITTVAGTGVMSFSGDGGSATSATLSFLRSAAVDSSGNLFIADANNARVRRVDSSTGVITTVAGNGTFGFSGDGGPATSASLNFPEGLAVDSSGNLFIAEHPNERVRRVDVATGIITTVAGTGVKGFSGDGGPATSAQLNTPFGLAVDALGNLFIANFGSARVRKVEGVAAVAPTPTPTPTPAAIPSLTQWGLVAMAVLMVAVVLWQLRRTSAPAVKSKVVIHTPNPPDM